MVKIGLKLSGAIIASTLLVSQLSARDFAEVYVECGLGALIAPTVPAVAAVTNVTWDLGTTAISSNISSPETCKGGKARTAAFILESYDTIEKEIAIGSGEYLDALVVVSGVESDKKDTFLSSVREEFKNSVSDLLYSSLTKEQKAENLYNIVTKNI